MSAKKIFILTTGGTFDKVYYDKLSTYKIGEPQIEWILAQANPRIDIEIQSVIKKDSLDMIDADRDLLKERLISITGQRIIIIHGTDTMVETANNLQTITNKTVVLTGAMRPARFRDSDAIFNTGFALAAVQLLPAGIFIAMNGKVFTPDTVQKNRTAGCFETIQK